METDNNSTQSSGELTPASEPASQASRNLAVFCWIGSAVLGFMPVLAFIPGLAVYLVKKDDAYVQDQAKEALNWGITVILLLIIGYILTVILIGFLVIGIATLCHFLFCIMGAVAASDGKAFRAPFAIRLIK